MKLELKDGKIQFDLYELLNTIDDAQEDEFDAADFMRSLGWNDRIRAEIIMTLREEFSTEHMSPGVHKDREALMQAMGEREIYYYANKIASIVETNRRWERNYWKLYHDTLERFGQEWIHVRGFPKPTEDIDFDFRRELEHILEKDMAQYMASKKRDNGERQ